MAYLSLSPVSVALYGALNVSSLTALATGGIFDDVPQGPTYPFLWYEVSEGAQLGGFGSKPGTKRLPEVEIRLHAFSQYAGMSEAQSIISKAIELLKDPPSVTGYGSWAIFWDTVVPLADEELNGVKVKELVAIGRLYVEEN